MQRKLDIKRQSRDIAGSASLALWANMNQSTTQLGSKRQSQGKHPYPPINISTCRRVVIICCVSIYFDVSRFWFSSGFLVHFIACRHLALQVICLVMLYEFIVCPLPDDIHTVTQWMLISMELCFFIYLLLWIICNLFMFPPTSPPANCAYH